MASRNGGGPQLTPPSQPQGQQVVQTITRDANDQPEVSSLVWEEGKEEKRGGEDDDDDETKDKGGDEHEHEKKADVGAVEARIHRALISSAKLLAVERKLALVPAVGSESLGKDQLDFDALRGCAVLLTACDLETLRDTESETVQLHVQELNELLQEHDGRLVACVLLHQHSGDKSRHSVKQLREAIQKLSFEGKVTKPLHVVGPRLHPLVQFLKEETGVARDLGVSFDTFFLIDSTGVLVGRFDKVFPRELEAKICEDVTTARAGRPSRQTCGAGEGKDHCTATVGFEGSLCSTRTPEMTMSHFAVLVLLLVVASLASVEGGRVNVVLLGATGNLAEKYLWQGLYNIYSEGLSTGDDLAVYPAATKSADKATPVLERILGNNITYTSEESKTAFLSRVSDYVQLREEEQFVALDEMIDADMQKTGEVESGRMFYLSVPPKFFGSIAHMISDHLRPSEDDAWLRVIVEKPFGVDTSSAEELADSLYESLEDEEILLVDHYMGKAGMHGIREFVKRNPLNDYLHGKIVDHVDVGMLETDDVSGRTGFYDEVGVVRDTMQNHLMMMAGLVAMGQPEGEGEEADTEADLRREVFERLSAASLEAVLLMGQYNAYNDHIVEDKKRWNEEAPAELSTTPTYAHVELWLRNVPGEPHWLDRAPLHFKSGKALSIRRSYLEIKLVGGEKLVFNLQGPSDEGLEGAFVHASKGLPDFVPPPGWKVVNEAGGTTAYAPDSPFAYEVLLRAGLQGETEHFVMLDEVLEAWRVWTPLLKELDQGAEHPMGLHPYPHGTPLHDQVKTESFSVPVDQEEQKDEL
ncbi:GDH/6PGL endoplasmic bifunctional protein [Includes: Hexose-6-phosphate dehydrogenase (Glucose 1-dehydrogenase) (GDH) (Glucose-6-phosphate dehydrogenase)) [Durusdinium trenchii]|uniref:GDH/6PGL endoplasmic bifunctional protein n=1 Tax=Durusdinium trenchii TaxID=1381693 RepID=A0ABP0QCJ3_9DINO